jgi:hypothetical protein
VGSTGLSVPQGFDWGELDGAGLNKEVGDVGEQGGGENLNGGADKRSLVVTLGS